MRPSTLRRRLALAGLGAILAGATLGTGIAKATPESDFFDALMAGGITIFDAGVAVDRGYGICAAFDEGANGEAVAQRIFKVADYAEVPTIDVARVWVIAAGTALCPWHYHPERQDARQVLA